MKQMRALCFALIAAFAAPLALAAPPPPVPSLPDSARVTTYTPTASTGPFSVGFALYGDGTDYANWIEVWLNGVKLTPVTDWTLSSATGPLATIPRPITNGMVTLTTARTGTLQIVGARRPRRISQFTEGVGVTGRDLNQVVTDLTAQNREQWDLQARGVAAQPGVVLGILPPPAQCAGKFIAFDVTGTKPTCLAGAGSGNVVGPASAVSGNLAIWNGASGALLADAGGPISPFGLQVVAAADAAAVRALIGGGIAAVPTGGTGVGSFVAGRPLIGNGTGPIGQGTTSGNTTQFATVSGAITPNNCLKLDANGNIVDAGSTCGANSNTPYRQNFVATTDFTPGVTTTLTLSNAPASPLLLTVVADGVTLADNTWSLSGSTITFSPAIRSSTRVISAHWYSPSTTAGVGNLNGVSGAVNIVAGGGVSVTPAGQNITVANTGVKSIATAVGDFLLDTTMAITGQTLKVGNWLSPLTGAVSRAITSKLGDQINAADFGVVCDGVTDTRVALQRAIDSTPIGGTLRISKQNTSGGCMVGKGSGNYALYRAEPIKLVCDTGVAINPNSALGTSNSVLYLVGSPNGVVFQTIIDGCSIANLGTATRFGFHGIVFDTTTAGNYFRSPIIKNVFIQSGTSGGGFGIYCNNNPVNNPNGGIYGGSLGENSLIQGGIFLGSSGDSITIGPRAFIPQNYAAGADNNGVYVALVNGAGGTAGNLTFDNINFTQSRGITIDAGYNIIFDKGEYELQQAATGSAIINLSANVGTVSSVRIKNAQFQAIGGIGNPLFINISSNAQSVTLEGNAIATPAGYTAVANASGSFSCGPNFWQTGLPHISGVAPAYNFGGC